MSAKQRLRLLVVDDEEMLRRLVVRVAEPLFAELDVASEGQQALSLLQQHSYDVVLTDLKMPGVGGLEVVAAARRWAPRAVRIVMTGFAQPDDELAIERAGAQLLRKPFGAHELRRTLRAAAELAASRPGAL